MATLQRGGDHPGVVALINVGDVLFEELVRFVLGRQGHDGVRWVKRFGGEEAFSVRGMT